jgi:hypothetical protein
VRLRVLAFLGSLTLVLGVHSLFGLAERDDFAPAERCFPHSEILLEVGRRAAPLCLCTRATEPQNSGQNHPFPHDRQVGQGLGLASIARAS